MSTHNANRFDSEHDAPEESVHLLRAELDACREEIDRLRTSLGASRVVPVRSVAHGFKVWKWSCPNCHAGIETIIEDQP